MIKRALLLVGLCWVALTVSACMSSRPTESVVNVRPTAIPPTDLTHDAMGKLGIRIIRIYPVYRVIVPVDPVFEVRSAEIKEEAYPGLMLLSDRLKHFMPRCMTVKGYTDSLGSYPEDQWLSEKQARSLTTFLWTQGLPHECLNPIGIGKDEAYTIASNRSVDGAVANRRIEITFRAR